MVLKFLMSACVVFVCLVGLSCNSWVGLWFMVEVSFLFFVGTVAVDSGHSVTEFMMKYYFIQVLSGINLCFFIMMSFFGVGGLVGLGVCLSLFVKLGMAPFHYWSISVLGKLSWFSFFMIMSFVKFLPLLFLSYVLGGVGLGSLLGPSLVVGSFFGMGNLSVQKVLGYSGVFSICWVLLSSFLGLGYFLVFFFGYVLLVLSLIYILSLINLFYVGQFKLFVFSSLVKALLFFGALSFSGVPPFLGFFLKWWVGWTLSMVGYPFLLILMVLFSLFSLIYYFHLFYYFMVINSLLLKWYGGCGFSFLGLCVFICVLNFCFLLWFFF